MLLHDVDKEIMLLHDVGKEIMFMRVATLVFLSLARIRFPIKSDKPILNKNISSAPLFLFDKV